MGKSAFRLVQLMVRENPNRDTQSIKEEIWRMTGVELDGRVIGGERRSLIYKRGKAA